MNTVPPRTLFTSEYCPGGTLFTGGQYSLRHRKAIVEELRIAFPGVRGISVRSLKRFCAKHNLHSTTRCSDEVLNVLVAYGAGIVSHFSLKILNVSINVITTTTITTDSNTCSITI